jgi:hypothetical protein
MPLDRSEAWRLTDSAEAILQDPEIAKAWQLRQIEATQLGGVWVFARCQPQTARPLLAPLIGQWALELAAAKA